jgi:group I intron endonuclease
MAQKKIAGIYRLTNLINGKVYIGQSVNIFNRWRLHKQESASGRNQSLITRAIRKYGWDSFSKEILQTVEYGQMSLLNSLEQNYIKENHSWVYEPGLLFPLGYNVLPGGSSQFAMPKSVKVKIGNSNRGKIRTSETKDKLRQAHLGKKSSELHRKNISEALKGIQRPSEFGRKISLSKKGVPWSAKTMQHQLELRGLKSLYQAFISISTGNVVHKDAKEFMCGYSGRSILRSVTNNTIYKGDYWRNLFRDEVDLLISQGKWSIEIMLTQREVRHYSGKL